MTPEIRSIDSIKFLKASEIIKPKVDAIERSAWTSEMSESRPRDRVYGIGAGLVLAYGIEERERAGPGIIKELACDGR